MTEARVYLPQELKSGASLELPDEVFRHVVQVLRLRVGATLTVFDGRGGEYEAVLDTVARRGARLVVGRFHAVDRESLLRVTLVQGVSKGERMDWTLQKAVELGVHAIAPVVTERCNVVLDADRWGKKLEHWRGVIVAACEQSGRTRLPLLHVTRTLAQWLEAPEEGPRYLLDPEAERNLAQFAAQSELVSLVVGPEGGLSAAELAAGAARGCIAARLGPRVLRTETAGVAALALLQGLYGDLR